jgi:DNA-binding PadR family transcriptional regulator
MQIIKPTLLDYAILGLIQNQSLSGYRIRKIFEKTALGNYSSSPGSIYPALKRLLKFDLVEKIKLSDTNKFQFLITQKGIQILEIWLLKTLEKNDVEKKIDELFLRFAFMDTLVKYKEKIIFLNSFKDLIGTYIVELHDHHLNESDGMPLHGRLAFEYGIEYYKTILKWSKKALIELNKNEIK